MVIKKRNLEGKPEQVPKYLRRFNMRDTPNADPYSYKSPRIPREKIRVFLIISESHLTFSYLEIIAIIEQNTEIEQPQIVAYTTIRALKKLNLIEECLPPKNYSSSKGRLRQFYRTTEFGKEFIKQNNKI